MNRIMAEMRAQAVGVPRVSGDEPLEVGELVELYECSSRERG
ncbi:hypothetical protein [Achromobacter xylosoxidans]